MSGPIGRSPLGPTTDGTVEFPDPAANRGALLSFDHNALITIPPGQQNQALVMQGGMPTWVSSLLPPGTTLPINQTGDLVVGGPDGEVARMPRGNVG